MLSELVMSTPVNVDGVSPNVVRPLSNVICLTVALPSHDILRPGTRTNVPDNFVYDMQVVIISVGILAVRFRACLLLY